MDSSNKKGKQDDLKELWSGYTSKNLFAPRLLRLTEHPKVAQVQIPIAIILRHYGDVPVKAVIVCKILLSVWAAIAHDH
jgi:hypothetical protein